MFSGRIVRGMFTRRTMIIFIVLQGNMIDCTVYRPNTPALHVQTSLDGGWHGMEYGWNMEYRNAYNQISQSPHSQSARADKFSAALVQWCTDWYQTLV